MELDIDNMDFPLPDQNTPSENNISITKEQLKEQIKDWMCIYPVYIDSKKTKDQGRKIGKEFCCESPQALAMFEALKKISATGIGINGAVLEDKKHPKDQLRIGRIKVNYTGNKKELLKKVSELVPECQKELDEKRKTQEAATSANSGSSSNSKPTNSNKKGNSKKKGKKRR
ncbi:signal recognition particle, SRP19 subunit [Anaeromyces robustus]|uniref:Signal recognition particle, SRP19 subunit n=1 Tax=Anaeromyces robustus TaxID=1754192 RepID=A0A1Y1XDE6_9FUNG|nr:signal recognition particle, SRP19 subunit [Anaeromyces robustus]|eukprot:ORX83790.1 signal recognition particle, SRP19 subunit [Anaeromyces robustus]